MFNKNGKKFLRKKSDLLHDYEIGITLLTTLGLIL